MWLLQLEKESDKVGKLYPLFMLSYSTMRIFLECLRDTQKDWFFMSHGQWFALAAIVLGILWLQADKRKNEYST